MPSSAFSTLSPLSSHLLSSALSLSYSLAHPLDKISSHKTFECVLKPSFYSWNSNTVPFFPALTSSLPYPKKSPFPPNNALTTPNCNSARHINNIFYWTQTLGFSLMFVHYLCQWKYSIKMAIRAEPILIICIRPFMLFCFTAHCAHSAIIG